MNQLERLEKWVNGNWSSISRTEYVIYIDEILQEIDRLQDEVCEWRFTKVMGKYKYLIPCLKEFLDESITLCKKYCPYCGKKIKEVRNGG